MPQTAKIRQRHTISRLGLGHTELFAQNTLHIRTHYLKQIKKTRISFKKKQNIVLRKFFLFYIYISPPFKASTVTVTPDLKNFFNASKSKMVRISSK